MITVKDFVSCACFPKKIEIIIGDNNYPLLPENIGTLDKTLLNAFGDYVLDDIKATGPDQYTLWVMQRPVTARDVEARA